MIQVRIDPRAALGYLSRAEQEQLPFAVSQALNQLANRAQAAEREHIRQAFKLRRESFVLRGVYISKADRATKSSWRVVVQLQYPDARHFLDQHEEGGQRRRQGGRYLWQPNEEVFKSKVISASNPLAPKNLHVRRTDHDQIKGDHGTFMVRAAGGQRLVLQRVARTLDGRSRRGMKGLTLENFAGGMGPNTRKQTRSLRRTEGVRLLYRLVSTVKIPARLQFVETVSKTVQGQFAEVARAALTKAMGTAK